MSQKHDKAFVTLVSVVIGGLIGLAFGIFALSSYVGARAETLRETNPDYRKEVQERIAPVGRVAVAGADNAALAIAPSGPPVAAAAAAPAAVMGGEETYKGTCSACHG